MHDLGTPGGADSAAGTLNERGQIAGDSFTNSIANTVTGIPMQHAFSWSWSRGIDLGTLGTGTDSAAQGINDAGLVTGWSNIDTGFDTHRVTLVDLGTLPGGHYSQAQTVNARGDVAGFAETALIDPSDAACGVPTTFHSIHTTLCQQGTIVDLQPFSGDSDALRIAINNVDQPVGFSGSGCTTTGAALWQRGTVTDPNTALPANSGWYLHVARGISDRGQIVGVGTNLADNTAAFLLTALGEGLPLAVDRQSEVRAGQLSSSCASADELSLRYWTRAQHGSR